MLINTELQNLFFTDMDSGYLKRCHKNDALRLDVRSAKQASQFLFLNARFVGSDNTLAEGKRKTIRLFSFRSSSPDSPKPRGHSDKKLAQKSVLAEAGHLAGCFDFIP